MPRVKKRKHSLKDPKFSTHYIPPFRDVLEFLQLPHSAITIGQFLNSEYGIDLGVSRSTLGNLDNQGVSHNTWQKLSTAVGRLFEGVSLSRDLVRETIRFARIRSNYASWNGFFEGYKANNHEDTDDFIQHVLFKYVKSRADIQKAFMLPVRKLKLLENANDKRAKMVEYHMAEADLFRNHSLIPTNIIDNAQLLLSARDFDEFKGDERKHLWCYCLYQQWDFYLSTLAYFEASVRYLSVQPEEIAELNDLPTPFERVFNKIEEQQDPPIRNCFEALLDTWRSSSSRYGTEVSWAKFASPIPTSSAETESGETPYDRKRSQLKKWRQGKEYPSDSMLKSFLTAHSWIDNDLIDLMVFQARIAKGFDKLTSIAIEGGKQDGFSDDETLQIVHDIVSRYRTYYREMFYSDIFHEWLNIKKKGRTKTASECI